jgi:hypothetical protein
VVDIRNRFGFWWCHMVILGGEQFQRQ